MKFPDYVACVSAYYDNDPNVIVMRSIAISDPKRDKLLISRYFDIRTDYIDDDACEEIDAIVGDFKAPNKVLDLFFSEDPYPLSINPDGGYLIQCITKADYIRIVNSKKKLSNS